MIVRKAGSPRGSSSMRAIADSDSPKGAILLASVFFLAVSGPTIALSHSKLPLAATLVIIAALLLRQHGISRLRIPFSVVIALAAMFVTALWSLEPGTTVRVSALYAMCTIVALQLGSQMGIGNVARPISIAGCSAAIASWALAYWVPALGRDTSLYQTGSLRGIYPHRNILAFVMVLAIVATATRLSVRGRGTLWTWFCFTGLVGTLLATRSATGIVSVTVGVGLVATLRFANGAVRPHRSLLILYVIGASGVMAWAVLADFSRFTASLGRDPTLTGRTEIWSLVAKLIKDRPYTGFGLDAVWGDQSVLGNHIRATLQIPAASHAHNGYLDAALQLGLPGSILFYLVFAQSGMRAYRHYVTAHEGRDVAGLAIIATLALTNLVETRCLTYMGWSLAVFLLARVVRSTAANRPLAEKSSTTTGVPRSRSATQEGRLHESH